MAGAMDSVFGEVLDKGQGSKAPVVNAGKQEVKAPSSQEVDVSSSQEVKVDSGVDAPVNEIARLEAELKEAKEYQAGLTEGDARFWQAGNKISNLQGQLSDLRYREQQRGMNAIQNRGSLDDALSAFKDDSRFGELSGLIRTQLDTPQGQQVFAQSPEKFRQLVSTMYKSLAFDMPQGQAGATVKGMGSGAGSKALGDVLSVISDEQREEFRKWNLPTDDKSLEKFAPYVKQEGQQLSHTMTLRGIRPKGAPKGMWNEGAS